MDDKRRLKEILVWTVPTLSLIMVSFMLIWLLVLPLSAQTNSADNPFEYSFSGDQTVELGDSVSLDLSLRFAQTGTSINAFLDFVYRILEGLGIRKGNILNYGITVSFPDGGDRDYADYSQRWMVTHAGESFYCRGNTQVPDVPCQAQYTAIERVGSINVTDRAISNTLLDERITITPNGNTRLFIRAWICDEDYQNCLRYPSGTFVADQQGHGVYPETVMVRTPRTGTDRGGTVTEPPPECRLSNVDVSPNGTTILQGESIEFSARVNFSPARCANDGDVSFEWRTTNSLGTFSGNLNSNSPNFIAGTAGEGQVILTASFQDDEITESVQVKVQRIEDVKVTIASDAFYRFSRAPQVIQDRAICQGENTCIFILAGSSVMLRGIIEGYPGSPTPRWRFQGDGARVARLSSPNSLQTELTPNANISRITRLNLQFGLDADNSNVASRSIEVIVVPIGLGVQLGGCSASLYELGGRHYVLTAEHCVTEQIIGENMLEISQRVELTIGDDNYDGVLLGIDQATDLAVLLVQGYDNVGLPNTSLSFSVSKGDKIYAIGYPGDSARERHLVVTSSEVTEVSSCRVSRPILNRDGKAAKKSINEGITTDGSIGDNCISNGIIARPPFIDEGNSGGPVINEAGDIVAIASAKLEDEKGTPVQSVLSFFSSREALGWLLSSNRRCFRDFDYTETDIEEGVDQGFRAVIDCDDEDAKVTVRTAPLPVSSEAGGLSSYVVSLPVFDNSPIVYIESSSIPWWVYIVVGIALGAILPIALVVILRSRSNRKEVGGNENF